MFCRLPLTAESDWRHVSSHSSHYLHISSNRRCSCAMLTVRTGEILHRDHMCNVCALHVVFCMRECTESPNASSHWKTQIIPTRRRGEPPNPTCAVTVTGYLVDSCTRSSKSVPCMLPHVVQPPPHVLPTRVSFAGSGLDHTSWGACWTPPPSRLRFLHAG